MNKSGMMSCDNLDKKNYEICLQVKMNKKSFSKIEISRSGNHFVIILFMITLDDSCLPYKIKISSF